MKLIVGLGNPGRKYATTRHNAGFLAVDWLLESHSGQWVGKKFDSELGKAEVDGTECVILKPQSFMNLSGGPVAAALRFYKLGLGDLLIFHDDIDLTHGLIKQKVGGGHGGHNGLRSIVGTVGSGDFSRIRLGVGRPSNPNVDVASWVLSEFSASELSHFVDNMKSGLMPILSSELGRKS